jgi:NAD(P)-dependent dehydrogenase (short-subunit alcohol dehydrogenase family)
MTGPTASRSEGSTGGLGAKPGSRFVGRTAVVTGGAQGIGKALIMAFAAEGAKVAAIDVDEGALKQTAAECREMHQVELMCLSIDVTSQPQVEAGVRSIAEAYGGIDVWVNNAGVLPPAEPFESTSDATWQKIMAVNLMGVVNGCRAVIPIMKKQRWGRILNASSMYGVVPQYQSAAYCASKAAVIAITRVLASELGPFGVTVNAYAPGATRTRLAGASLEGSRGQAKLKEIPLRRFAEPEDIASVVVFLASDDAGYVSGTTLLIDGGRLAIQSPERIP